MQKNETNSIPAALHLKGPRLEKHGVLLHIESCLFHMTTFEYDTYALFDFPNNKWSAKVGFIAGPVSGQSVLPTLNFRRLMA